MALERGLVEVGCGGHDGFGERLPVLIGGVPTTADANDAAHFVGSGSEGTKNDGRAIVSGTTSGAGGDGEAAIAESGKPFAVVVTRKDEHGGVPESWGVLADDAGAGKCSEKILFKGVALSGRGGGEVFIPCDEGSEHRGDGGIVFGAGTASFFLGAAGEKVGSFVFITENEKADAFGATEFMGAAGEVVAFAEVIGGKFSKPLGGVAVERDVLLATGGGHLAPGVQGAAFVAGGHRGDESPGLGGELLVEGGEVEGAVGECGDEVDGFGKMAVKGFADAGVLDAGAEDGGVGAAS